MKLYYHPLSPYSRKVRAALLYRDEPHELEVVDVRSGALASPAFRALSPFGKMPVLVTDDGPMIETSSIIEWLEERGPRRLLPRGTERVARHWDRIGDLYLMDPQSTLFFQPNTEAATEARATVHAAWRLFADRLEGRAFVCGDLFTLGDLSGAIATAYLERLGEEPPDVVRAWRERIYALPALVQTTEEGEGELATALERRRARTDGS